MTRPRFHLAFPVRDLAEARAFYGQTLGCEEGRSAAEWVDFDFFGHQIVAHLSTEEPGHNAHNEVDGDAVPVRHFGVILAMAQWRELAKRLKEQKVNFVIAPDIRFVGQAGEQATFFITDPSGNALEFKAFADEAMIFRPMSPRSAQIALAMGAIALALMLGALGFQYIGGYPPCEMCMWQRYPHIAAAIIGLGGGLVVQSGVIDRRLGRPLAVLTILLVALSGAIGVFHAGVEWHWWKGPATCTGNAFSGALDLNAKVVMCDVAAWRLFGISMAGYNALISLGSALLAVIALTRAEKRG